MSEIKNIPIKGIVRNTPPELAPEGSCSEIINLREDGGVWRAVGDPKIVMEDCPLRRFTSADLEDGGDGTEGIIESADIKSIYLHHTSQGDKLIGVVHVDYQISESDQRFAQRTYIRYCDYPNGTTVSSVMKHWVYPNGLEQDLPFFLDGYRDIRFNSLNDMLVIFIDMPETPQRGVVEYALFKDTEFILMPPLGMPDIDVCLEERVARNTHLNNGEVVNIETYEGALTGKTTVIAAYETTGGNFVNCSPPVHR